jgi:DNA-binding CsgD family transcriptional regulator
MIEALNRTVHHNGFSSIIAASRAAESLVAVNHLAKYFNELGELQKCIYTFQQVGLSAARVCNGEAAIDSRLGAADYLIELWKPYPFDPQAKLALRAAGSSGRDDLRRDLPLRLLFAAVESTRTSKPRRVGRRWLKDATGKRAKISLLDLEIRDFLRALRTLTIKTYEQLVLSVYPVLISREMRDSDGAYPDRARSIGRERPLVDLRRRQLQALSFRERQLWNLLTKGMSCADAGRRMGISPSTARVFFHRIRKKLRKPM